MLTKNRAVCCKASVRKVYYLPLSGPFNLQFERPHVFKSALCCQKFSFGNRIVEQKAGNDIKSTNAKEPIHTEAR